MSAGKLNMYNWRRSGHFVIHLLQAHGQEILHLAVILLAMLVDQYA